MAAYATVEDVREEGITASEASDDRVSALIQLASAYIERVTGFWFDRRNAQTFLLDGSGTPILELPQPPIQISAVKVDGVVVDPDRYVVHNRRETDDQWYPRLEMKSGLITRLERAMFGGGGIDYRAVWGRGQLNVEVTGDFGFVEPDDSTPPLIRRATVLLVVGLARPVATAATDQRQRGRIRSESFGNYSYTLADIANGANLTGDPEIDAILVHYRRVPTVTAA